MKLIYIFLFALLLGTSGANAADDWGQNGHRAIAEIAFQYLDEEVKQIVIDLLGGESMALASTFADEIKSDKKYDAYKPWHYVNMPLNSTYAKAEKNEKGDIVVGIEECIAVLKDKRAKKEDRVFYLKMLIHLIGDLHQPFHIGLKEDRGGNNFKVFWFGEKTNIHRLWDTQLIESYNMSYTELASNTYPFTKKEIKKLTSTNVMEWVSETHQITRMVYQSAQPDENLSYAYTYKWFPVLRQQLHKAGIRLAAQLNEIYKA